MLNVLPFSLLVSLFLVVSLLITYHLIPKIIWVAREKELLVKPDHRSSHRIITPSFGGVAFFITFILCYSFLRSLYPLQFSTFIIPAVTTLFIVGLKDDLVVSSAWAKLAGQLIAIGMLLANPEFYGIDLHGFLGIHELSPWVSIPIIFFFMVGFVNAYNLIDGIDGLAAFLGIVMFGAFAFIFHQVGMDFYVLFCMIGIGMLLAFIRFNFSKSVNRKIFMGDTGSLVIGFILAYLAIKALTVDCSQLDISCQNLPAFILMVMSIPIYDTLRIMVLRKLSGSGIFTPDRNHIHHILIDLGLTHFRTSLILSVVAIIMIFVSYQVAIHGTWPVLILFILAHAVVASFLFHYLKKNVRPLKIKRRKMKGKVAWAKVLF